MYADQSCYAIYRNVNERLKTAIDTLIDELIFKINNPKDITDVNSLVKAEIRFKSGEVAIVYVKQETADKVIYCRKLGLPLIEQRKKAIETITYLENRKAVEELIDEP
jgi:hypothetical protein